MWFCHFHRWELFKLETRKVWRAGMLPDNYAKPSLELIAAAGRLNYQRLPLIPIQTSGSHPVEGDAPVFFRSKTCTAARVVIAPMGFAQRSLRMYLAETYSFFTH